MSNPLREAAELVDRIYSTRETVDDHRRVIEALEESIKRDTERLSLLMEQSGSTEVAGANARAKWGTKSVPQVRDWPSLYDYIRSSGAFELLHKRIGVKAWQERVDAGLTVPGVEQVIIPEMKITGRNPK
jgi:hypothetical protein